MGETYSAAESRITQVIEILHKRLSDEGSLDSDKKPNISAIAREFCVSESRLRARWKGRQSKQERPAANQKLREDRELAVCQYLDRLDKIGLSARLPMVTNCANAILRRNHTAGDTTNPPPQVDKHWTTRFLERHPQYLVREQEAQEIDRKLHRIQIQSGVVLQIQEYLRSV